MIWENVHFLWFLLLIPGIIFFRWFSHRQRKQQRERYFGKAVFERLFPQRRDWVHHTRHTLFLLGIVALVIALAGPKVGTEVREVKRQGVDIIVALDVSLSMKAEDVKPNRLDKAKYEASRLLDRLKGDRVGLIIFTGEAFLQSPLTTDYSALRLFLNIVDTDQMPSSTTSIEPALRTALTAFQSADKEKESDLAGKVLLIISDGEDQEDSYEGALEELVDYGVDVFTIGIGTEMGSTIPMYDKKTGKLLGYKRNNRGEVVVSKLKTLELRNVAEKGNGDFYQITRGNEGLDRFLQRLEKMEKGEFAKQEYADFKNQYQWFAAGGFFFIFFSIFLPTHKLTHST